VSYAQVEPEMPPNIADESSRLKVFLHPVFTSPALVAAAIRKGSVTRDRRRS
jgi:hypothetical protein